jgi:hypothetical protein
MVKMKMAEILSKRAAEASEKLEQVEERPREMFLPGLDEAFRAMPNHLARSSIFAPVARGRKKLHKDTVLASRGDTVIRFSGEQLDESQADVWMQAMYEAVKQPLGEYVTINRATFLAAIGRNQSGVNYLWLQKAMDGLAFAMIKIVVTTKKGETKLTVGKVRALHLIDSYALDEETNEYSLKIDPRWVSLYSGREFALIDWEKRLQFGRNQDAAKSIQRLIAASSDKIQRYSLEWLATRLEYNSPIRKFKEALASACNELQRLEIVSEWKIEESTKGKLQLALWIPVS